MPTCPQGHDSGSADFCDVCGIRITAAGPAGSGQPPTGPAGSPRSAPDQGAGPDPGTAGPACPRCGSPRTGRFCESCGLDLDSAAAAGPWPDPAAGGGQDSGGATTGGTSQDGTSPDGGSPDAGTWSAEVTSDRGYYDAVIAEGGPDAGQTEFPGYCPERRFALTGAQMRIGRRSVSRGIEPEIDLTGPPTDPGISRLHAVLASEPDGSWAVFDPGSANGTLVNGGEIPAGARVPLRDGDRINLGAWTLITVRGPSGQP